MINIKKMGQGNIFTFIPAVLLADEMITLRMQHIRKPSVSVVIRAPTEVQLIPHVARYYRRGFRVVG